MTWTPPAGTAALIFDCDGTLADTMPAHFRAWSVVMAAAGIPFPEARFYQLGGMPTSKIIPLMCEEAGLPVPDVAALTVAKEAAFLEVIDAVQPLAPVLAVAEAYRGRLPLAVASGGYRRVVSRTLAVIGVGGWFDAVVCADDTERHKPDPDVFLEAARRLGVEPTRCVAFEDTDLGLEAVRRANMIGVDVRPWVAAGSSTGS